MSLCQDTDVWDVQEEHQLEDKLTSAKVDEYEPDAGGSAGIRLEPVGQSDHSLGSVRVTTGPLAYWNYGGPGRKSSQYKKLSIEDRQEPYSDRCNPVEWVIRW